MKPPFFARRWVQVSLALLAGVAAMVVVVWATNGVRAEHRRSEASTTRAKATSAVARWQAIVDPALSQAGFDAQKQQIPALAQLSTTIKGMQKTGAVGSAEAKQAGAAASTFRAAADAIGHTDASTVIANKGLNAYQASALIDAQTSLVTSLRAAQVAEDLIGDAASAPLATAKALLARARTLADTAQTTFSSAYGEYFNVTASFGLSSLPGVPGGPAIPGATG